MIKTLVMEDEKAAPLIVLMHGDLEVSTKALARQIGAKSVQPCKPEIAQRNSGCMPGNGGTASVSAPVRVTREAE